MLPSLVIEEVRRGVAETLRTQFEPSTELFKDAVRRLIDQPSWVKGPYVQLGLPFVAGAAGKTFFADFETEHPAHRHQELAWQRCGVQRKSTLVATGTGSGKTECFLYPVLDHVAKARAAGQKGIKAIIIYPMNALADDQAGRIADLVHKTPAFAGIRAGLYVGSGKPRFKAGETAPQDAIEMGPDHVITDKGVQRNDPPDILLTNYKMLDFLMIRPQDQPLWRFNEADTLQYLVVDELHTFDGAQGTDLAMLIRRLRRRLGCEGDELVCVGTSATLGGGGDTLALREYANQIFATPFAEGSVITEARQGFDAFIGDRVVEHLMADDDAVLAAIANQNFSDQREAVLSYLPAFFARTTTLERLRSDIDTGAGRTLLGEELKKHLLFQTLLRSANQIAVSVEDIADKVQRTLSSRLTPYATDIVTGLLSLIAWARAPYPGQSVTASSSPDALSSLVSLRVQVWLQELRRVLATVDADPESLVMMSEANVLEQRQRLRLPIVQCSQCRATGWLTIKRPQDSRVEKNPDLIYAAFFARHPDATLARIYPKLNLGGGQSRPMTPLLPQKLCGGCGALNAEAAVQCGGCQSDTLVPVHIANSSRQKQVEATINGAKVMQDLTVHDDTCPVCGQRDNQMILGAQTTTVAAHAVERLWSAPLNNHKKLILFSDSVQDAAHRAGFLESKTENHLMRAALARAIETLPDRSSWANALNHVGGVYLEPGSALTMPQDEFASRFIPPRLEWMKEWVGLTDPEKPVPLAEDSQLLRYLCQLMQWRAVEELTHLSDRGATLHRAGLAALYPDLKALHLLTDKLAVDLRESRGGLDEVSAPAVFQWALGTILMLIRSGGVFHLGLDFVAETGDYRRFEFSASRARWIPHRRAAPTPRFLTDQPGRHGFLNFEERDTNPLINWAKQSLVSGFTSPGIVSLAYAELLKALTAAGIGRFIALEDRGQTARVFGLNPDNLFLCQDLCLLTTATGAQTLWAPAEAVDQLENLPAWNSPGEVFRPDPAERENWWHARLKRGDITRVIAHEHTGLLERDERVDLQGRFMAKAADAKPWFENVLSATPTLEMGINIGELSSVMLGGVPPNQANFVQRIGRAGRLDGNAAVFTIAAASPDGHDQYYFSNPMEMLAGAVEAPAIYLGAAEVLRRQLYAFFFDHWVAEGAPALPSKLSEAMDEVAKGSEDKSRFPYNYLDFVNRNEPPIFDAFCRMLGDYLLPETKVKLEGFLKGSEQHKHLRARFLAYFEECNAERDSWKKRRKDIGTQLVRLKKLPADEQTTAEIETLEKERGGLSQRIQQLNNEQLLEAMTNAGLLPNYAFPEEGVSLTTIIHGKKPKSGEEYSVPVHRYSRPAHAALAEFAPRNTFFAHKSKVQIDQIDLGVEPPSLVRFCASCHFLVADSDPQSHEAACPRCGDTRFSDGSQIRPMLRLKRAVANVDRQDKTRITESDEGREQRFYQRRLLMNFLQEDVRTAWTFESAHAIYGFEFLSRADFHDVNLGQPTVAGGASLHTVIAGDDSPKAGFSLCGACGKVQPFYRARANDDSPRKQEHTPDCRNRHDTGTEHLSEDLFLFRHFESECLRILVPKGFGSGDRTTYSFMSALQLGMRKRFGGKVDHLRFETMDEAGGDEQSGKTYILIYDSVPGGTGYLQQLLAGDADTLTEVLKTAHGVIFNCACQNKPDTDGCYQCVFQHRQGRSRRHISRLAALEMLEELVTGDFTRKSVPCLSEIYINSAFGSELERRFFPALKALGGQMDLDNGRLPVVSINQDIKEGKTSFLLSVGANKYWVDQQVPIENPVNGLTLCEADFLISPTKTASPMRPIVVFVDGWEFHQKSLPADARKRASLMLRADYRVWSVTYEDIEAALKQKAGTDLDSPLPLLSTATGTAIPVDRLPPIGQVELQSNAIAQLLRVLGVNDAADGDPMASLASAGRHLLIRTVNRSQDVTAEQKARSESVVDALPEWLTDVPMPVPLQGPGGKGVQWVGAATPKFVSGVVSDDSKLVGALVLDDRNVEIDAASVRIYWRNWLRITNLLQAVYGVALLTESMIADAFKFEVLSPAEEIPTTVDASWNQILDADEFLERLKPGFLELANTNIKAPDAIGEEIDDGDGYRVAEAVWTQEKLVLVTIGQRDSADVWRALGYKVVEEAGEWWNAVGLALTEAES